MTKIIIVRFGQAIATVMLMSVLVFALARVTGNPLDLVLSPYASNEQVEKAKIELGLDRPLAVQYALFLERALRGDFGNSLYYRRPVLPVVFENLGATSVLGVVALMIALCLAVPLGVASAVKRDTVIDGIARTFAVLGQSVPNFWLGIILIELLSVDLRLLPSGGRGGFDHIILPAFTLGWFMTAGLMRITRSAMLDVLDSEYIKFARLKGLSEFLVIWKHGLSNALIPVITFAGMIFAELLVGSIVVETIFSWPGIGRLAYQALIQRDFPLLQIIVITFTIIYVLLNMCVDVVYAWLDPRISRA